MNLKPLVWTVAILAVLSAVVFVTQRRTTADPGADPRIGKPLIDRETLAGVRSLRLVRGEESVEVRLADEAEARWMVTSYYDLPADFSKISSLTDSLGRATIKRFITASPERIARLGFPGDRVEVRDATDSILWAAEFGQTAEGGGRLVRFPDEDRVYLADFAGWLDLTSRSWANARLITFATADVNSFEIGFPEDGTIAFDRDSESGSWVSSDVPEGRDIRGYEIDSVIGRLSGLRFTETADPDHPDVVAARERARRLSVALKDGTVYEYRLGRRPAPEPAEDGEGDDAPAAGPVYVFIHSTNSDDPINTRMRERAFQVGEWIYTGLPDSPDALLEEAAADREPDDGEPGYREQADQGD